MSQEIDREKGQRIIDDFARYGNETPYWSGRGCFFTPCLHGRGPTLAEQAEAFYRVAKRKTLYERLYARPSRTLLASWKSLKRENRAKPAEPRPLVLPLHGGLIDVGPLLQGTTMSAQGQSPFLTLLPLEIRNHIYSFVLPPQSRVWVRYRPLERTKGRLRSANSGGRLPLEHFPCREVPSDMRYTERYEHCGCEETYRGFFGRVDALGLQPHQDTLSLFKTCQRIYLDIAQLSTFCFDDLETLNDFTSLYKTIPVRHLQVVLYHSRMIYYEYPGWLVNRAEHESWQEELNGTWERKLQHVSRACSRVPGLQTLLLSVHGDAVFGSLANKKAAMESLQAITAAPILHAEVMTYHYPPIQGPYLLRVDGEGVELNLNAVTR